MTTNVEQIIDEIIDSYIQLPARGGRQQRQEKTHQEWKRILQRESRNGFGQNSVLVHRAIRTSGKAYLSTKQVFISTNFVVYTMSTYEEALLLPTWMTTIFYQLICEVTSKDQEGMRKMEVADINTTFIPQLDMISLNTRNRINEIKDEIVFLNLKNPEIRLKYDNDAKYYVYLYKHFANIKAVVHTHSTNTVAWAQAGRSLPVYGTTHANTFYSEVPITRHLTNEEVTESYEWNTGKVIVEAFENQNLDPSAIPTVLVNSHGPCPFT